MGELKVEQVDINKIKPYWRNPRKHDNTVELLKESIKKFGFNVPIIVDKNYTIITGHARYKALLQLGYKKVPVIVKKDLTEKQVKEYRIADNKIAELSTWDYNNLKKELMELDSILGFTEEEVEALLNLKEEKITVKDIEKAEKELVSKFEKSEKEMITITCPFCLKQFKIAKNELIPND